MLALLESFEELLRALFPLPTPRFRRGLWFASLFIRSEMLELLSEGLGVLLPPRVALLRRRRSFRPFHSLLCLPWRACRPSLGLESASLTSHYRCTRSSRDALFDGWVASPVALRLPPRGVLAPAAYSEFFPFRYGFARSVPLRQNCFDSLQHAIPPDLRLGVVNLACWGKG